MDEISLNKILSAFKLDEYDVDSKWTDIIVDFSIKAENDFTIVWKARHETSYIENYNCFNDVMPYLEIIINDIYEDDDLKNHLIKVLNSFNIFI